MDDHQQLFLPYRYCEVLCGYRVAAYRAHWGYEHFGIDTYSYDNPDQRERGVILASGNGEVVACGADRVGNVVVIVYPGVLLPDGKICDLAARYYHLARILVAKGDKVNFEAPIGIEGNTGTSGYHLHMELDTDCSYPCHSPQVKGGEIIKRGTDSTLDPLTLLHARPNQVQKSSRYGKGWNNPQDTLLRFINPNTGGEKHGKGILL